MRLACDSQASSLSYFFKPRIQFFSIFLPSKSSRCFIVGTYCNTPLQLQIYDLAGRFIKTFLLKTNNQQLTTKIVWDGKNNAGWEKLSSLDIIKSPFEKVFLFLILLNTFQKSCSSYFIGTRKFLPHRKSSVGKVSFLGVQ
jgi:hypothetical protein